MTPTEAETATEFDLPRTPAHRCMSSLHTFDVLNALDAVDALDAL